VVAEATYKQDVDPAEAGCVRSALYRVGEPRGCRLELEFGAVEGGGGGLRRVTLHADSLCPGFSDAREGSWSSGPGYGAWWAGPTHVAAATAAADTACVQGATIGFRNALVRLSHASGAVIDVNLADLSLVGDLALRGDPSPGLSCPAVACGPDLHDGGDGWCVAAGLCAPGWRDGGLGACVPAGLCDAGFHDDGAGNCVTEGVCAADYHDGGNGSCVPLGACASGHHDGGLGVCLPTAECEPGFYLEGSACWAFAGVGLTVGTRESSFAAPLPGGGVFLGGGLNGAAVLADTELFVPGEGFRAGPSMASSRTLPRAVLLADGRVLVAGGFGGLDYALLAEVFDPGTGAFAPAGTMRGQRTYFTLTRLPSGTVIAVGGSPEPATAEVWDPVAGVWTATPALGVPRTYHSATALLDGRLLVAGGMTHTAEIYDPVGGTWTPTGSMAVSRSHHAAVRLLDGTVVVFGGTGGAPSPVERWDPATGLWSPAGEVRGFPFGEGAALLPSGKVLVLQNSGRVNELFDPAENTTSPAGTLAHDFLATRLVQLTNGQVMALGSDRAQMYVGPQ
jgi:hypothetical protein